MRVDLVNNPPHYSAFGFESLELLEKVFNLMPEKNMIFYIGNALKYAIRSKFKGNEIQDLKKCEFYIKKCSKLTSEDFKIFESKEIMHYLTKISEKDFKLFLLINDIIHFALNPSQRNYNAVENHIKKYIRERI
ncbi:DUF3310 domain-containing protein [Campylobacter jejuni]|uniref:DUF3310 domain-containing protein n=1 Tax=Campylobacter jejuni TaxID=197 RepID=UPI00073DBBF8|nr:DUF3310 domain-containing protein [Campylobacter jejuni]ALW15581.1 hypothetical protein RC26_02490 [Campylobacter jejuni]HED5364296.1 DUF3310 domain-containing protein [Campylobacter jejuni]